MAYDPDLDEIFTPIQERLAANTGQLASIAAQLPDYAEQVASISAQLRGFAEQFSVVTARLDKLEAAPPEEPPVIEPDEPPVDEWTAVVPSERLRLQVTTPINNQELTLEESTGIAYWEGMIDVAGTIGTQRVTGVGYLEMTGYHGSLGRVMSGRW